MRRVLYFLVFMFLFALTFASTGFAYMLGEETKGVTIKVTEDVDMNVRVRLQPRLDFGDLVENSAGTSYDSESDLYFRRVRLYVKGHLIENLQYNLTLDADKWGKTGNADSVDLYYAYLRYHYADYLNVEFGKHKLPYSRISLTSSSKQLLIERPASTEEAKNLFGAYGQFMVMADGLVNKFKEGEIKYFLAFADGIVAGDTVAAGRTAQSAGPLLIGRVEFSPKGYIEKSKSDAHLGKGKHLTVAFNYAFQNSIEFDENVYSQDRRLFGLDISFHYEELTLQAEYNSMKEDSNEPGLADVEPRGWYAQAGYFIPGYDIEPVVRYEIFDQDSNVNASKEEITTVGLNWYPKGHTLKVGANWTHSEFETNADGWLANDDSLNILQIQGQLYF